MVWSLFMSGTGKERIPPPPDTARPGRPRSRRAHAAILEATGELLDTEGYRNLTMQRIAERAGVGKQTLYRWWSCKAAVVLEALAASAERRVPIPDTGSLEGDLASFLRVTFRGVKRTGQTLTALMAEAQHDPVIAEALRSRLIDRRRTVVRQMLDRAAERGEIAPHVDRELLIDLLYGPMWYRLLNCHAPLDTRLADRLARAVVAVARGSDTD